MIDLAQSGEIAKILPELNTRQMNRFLKSVARKADSLNRQRVRRGENIDGDDFEKRKDKTRGRMFKTISKQKSMSIRVSKNNEAIIRHKGFLSRIALEHQEGKRLLKIDFSKKSGDARSIPGEGKPSWAQAGILTSYAIFSDEDVKSEYFYPLGISKKLLDKGYGAYAKIRTRIRSKLKRNQAGHLIYALEHSGDAKKKSSNPASGGYYQLPQRDLLGLNKNEEKQLLNYAEGILLKIVAKTTQKLI